MILLEAGLGSTGSWAAACESGAHVLIRGTVQQIIVTNMGTDLAVGVPSLDCRQIKLMVRGAGTCRIGASIRATGVMFRNEGRWQLESFADPLDFIRNFSCA